MGKKNKKKIPFIFNRMKYKLVPLMVGSLDVPTQDYYAKILVKYFDDPNTIFIISSDFCHWGKRFFSAICLLIV